MPNITNLNAAYLDTIGIELEGTAALAGDVRANLEALLSNTYSRRQLPYVVTRDASVESYADSAYLGDGRVLVYSHSPLTRNISGIGRGNELALGYELVLNPVEVKEFEKLVSLSVLAIRKSGDISSQRAATHFHVGFANNLRLLKNLLRICLWLDPLFFRLGGMGGRYRGYTNQSAYARPLMHPLAAVVGVDWNDGQGRTATARFRGEYVQEEYAEIINAPRALEAQSLEDFWKCFGVFANSTGIPKYHPARYCGFNFYAIAIHGTIEARHCNQTFNSKLIVAVGKLFRAVVELSASLRKGEEYAFPVGNSLQEISVSDSADIIKTLQTYFMEKDIENCPTDEEYSTIMETIAASKFDAISEIPVQTHINGYTIPKNLALDAGLNFVQKVSKPSQVDIHTIRQRYMVEDFSE